MTIIYGGSFNPPTLAHYQIAKHIINKFPNDEFFFLPTNNHYGKPNLEDYHIRMKMLEILCNKLDNKAKVSDFELKLDKYYGTAYTLKHFNNPCFVMGADNLITLPKWINFPNVVIDNKFIIIPRDDISIDGFFNENEIINKYKDNFIILNDFKNIYISSSEYRNTLNSDLLLDEINQYIKINNLYNKKG